MKWRLWFLLVVVFVIRFFATQKHFVNGQSLRIDGRIYSEPAVSYGKANFNLSGIKVTVLSDEKIHYGDYVVVEGIYKDGVVEKGRLVDFKYSNGFFESIRNSLVLFYKSRLAEPHASLVAGITIGAKSNISRNFGDKLKRTGTSHIVVASGTNVTLFGGFVLTLLLNFFPRKKSVILTIISIWFYVFVAGWEAPIVRAAIMASIAFVGQVFGRLVNISRVIFLTGILMLIVVPQWIGDIGFLLSFATTISMILFNHRVSNLLKFLPEIVREDLSTSIAAQIGSSPIIFFFFGNFNILSPFINLLILWTVPFIMIIGGVSGIISFVFPGFASLTLQLLYPLTSWFITVINLFG